MKNRVAFQTQFASILEVLAQAAVAEISKIVEDGTGELYFEVSRCQKEIDGLRSKLRQAESELKTVRETATRESRSVGVQVEVQFGAAGGADKGDADAPLVEHFNKKQCEIQTCDTGLDFGFAVKEEQGEERVAKILHQAESEHAAGRLNDVGAEYVMFEGDHQLWSSFTQEGGDETNDPVSNATERCSQSQTIPSPMQHTAATMETPGSALPSLEKDDHVIDGGVMKEEAGGQCLYTEVSRSEMGDAHQMGHGQPPSWTNDNLTLHVFHPVQQQLDLQIGVTENNMDPISSCNQNVNVSWRHHKEEKPYSCAQCQERFDCSTDLEKHQQIHTAEKPLSCAHCDKQFRFKCNLIRHERVHSGNKPYSCVHCGKRFSMEWNLDAHKRIHTGERPFTCSYCEKQFRFRCNLIRHERAHTGNKPFGCVHCGKRFALEWNLEAHNRIHTGERPYHCAQCGKNFIQLSALKAHQRIHSRNKMPEFDINGV